MLPLLFMLVFGVLEIGSALKSYSGSANAVRAGGRMASVAGNDADADRAILERMAREATGISSGEIEYVVIWHASSTGEQPPAACRPARAGVAEHGVGGCVGWGHGRDWGVQHLSPAGGSWGGVRYGDGAGGAAGGVLFRVYWFGGSVAGNKLDCNWPGRVRKTTLTPRGDTPPAGETGQPDYVGVYIRTEHSYVTGVLGDSLTITDGSVNLLEPQGYSVIDMRRFMRRGGSDRGARR